MVIFAFVLFTHVIYIEDSYCRFFPIPNTSVLTHTNEVRTEMDIDVYKGSCSVKMGSYASDYSIDGQKWLTETQIVSTV